MSDPTIKPYEFATTKTLQHIMEVSKAEKLTSVAARACISSAASSITEMDKSLVKPGDLAVKIRMVGGALQLWCVLS